jgi:putative redox protein
MGIAAEAKKESMSVSWIDGLQLAVEVRKHKIFSDQPADEGGKDQGITPTEMFIASLGTCMGYYAARFCQRHKMQMTGLKVYLAWDYAERPHRIGTITVRVNVPGEWDPGLKERLHKVIEGCTVHQSIIVPPKIHIEI